MKSGISVLADKMATLQKSLAALTQSKVLVGVPSKTAQREDDVINNAAIGYIQENGSPENNIPARPFLVPGVRNAQKDVAAIFRAGTVALLSGDMTRFKAGLNAAGITAADAVREKITDGPFAPLATSTLKARQRRTTKNGQKIKAVSIEPLIDTGQLRRAITYVIRGK